MTTPRLHYQDDGITLWHGDTLDVLRTLPAGSVDCVIDPFCGSGTTGMAAARHGRRFVGIDLSREYLDLALRTRLAQTAIIDLPSA